MRAHTASRESSPIRAGLRNGVENGYANTNGHTNGNGAHLPNGHSNAVEHSDDEYIDTVEVMCSRNAIFLDFPIRYVNVTIDFLRHHPHFSGRYTFERGAKCTLFASMD